jgi:hypothetical protein
MFIYVEIPYNTQKSGFVIDSNSLKCQMKKPPGAVPSLAIFKNYVVQSIG